MRARGRGAARMASQTSSKASACSPTLTAVSGARPGAAAARSSAGGVGGSGRPAPAPAVGGAFWGLGARAVRGPRHRHAHGIPPLLPPWPSCDTKCTGPPNLQNVLVTDRGRAAKFVANWSFS